MNYRKSIICSQLLPALIVTAGFCVDSPGWCAGNKAQAASKVVPNVNPVNVLIDQAHTSISAGKYNEADVYLHKALHLSQKPGHYKDHANVLKEIAQLRLTEKRYVESIAIGKHALGLAVKTHITDRTQLVPYWDVIAKAYVAEGRYSRSVPYLKRELRACKFVYGINSPNTIAVQQQLNQINGKLADMQKMRPDLKALH